MKIIQFHAENVKRLGVVDITPKGALVEITGKNRQGKSSVLDAIWWALGSAKHVQARPIRDGEDHAVISLTLGETADAPRYVVTRKFRKTKTGEITTSVTVENGEGARYPKAQETLDSLLGSLAFDPLEFERAKPGEQFEMLRSFVPGVDFDAIEAADKRDAEMRRAFNSKAKELLAQAAGIEGEPNADPVYVNTDALTDKLSHAASHNAGIEREADRRTQERRNIEARAKIAYDARKQAQALIATAEAVEKECEDRTASLAAAAPLPEPMDASAISAQLKAAQADNAAADAAKRKAQLLHDATSAEAQSADLTIGMAKRKADAEAKVAAAKIPVDGIGFEGRTVTLRGQPFEQGSDEERLTASMSIAAAMNPTLRIIRVREGSRMDDDAIRVATEFATEKGYQVWIETVNSHRPGAVVMEDGRVAGVPQMMAAE